MMPCCRWIWVWVIPSILGGGSAAAVTWHVAPRDSIDAGVLQDGSPAHPYHDLAAACRLAADRGSEVTLSLGPGRYVLEPNAAVEPTCGNCEDPATPVSLTYGLRLSGVGVRLLGAADHASILETRAGYGIWIQDCADCLVRGIVVTGGARDTSAAATDAAIVVQRSNAMIEECVLRDNIGDPEIVARTVVGIMGICGREQSRIRAVGNHVLRNSWDGIALYRDSRAQIVGNVIDGVDCAVGGRIGGGRGVGIGCTWNSQATIRGNLVRRYWKGIGVFLDADANVAENVVSEIATWGLSVWDAGRGHPQGELRWNAVDSTGACGISIAAEGSGPRAGGVGDNAITRTGQNPKYDSGEPYCHQAPIALHASPEGFVLAPNLFHANRRPDGVLDPSAPASDLSEREFRRRLAPLLRLLALHEATRESRFYRRWAPRD